MVDDDVLPFPHSPSSIQSQSAAADIENESNWDYFDEASQACSDDEPPMLGNSFEAKDGDQTFDSISTASFASTIPEPASDVDIDEWHGFDEFQDLDEQVSLEEMLDALDDMVGPDATNEHNQFGVAAEIRRWDERRFGRFFNCLR
ncbi:hypothetical protein C8F04DRAFT_1196216 [Mycena alexandri]|uniref:Uncharacterized protein n=1 Tax=Mycena alexandri TaxID=1745969 RepID=A0AAD6WRB6_9AGAR|nr:hypothetical protein C8F04DRAFT_1196216 [Mycena alexandri]